MYLYLRFVGFIKTSKHHNHNDVDHQYYDDHDDDMDVVNNLGSYVIKHSGKVNGIRWNYPAGGEQSEMIAFTDSLQFVRLLIHLKANIIGQFEFEQ